MRGEKRWASPSPRKRAKPGSGRRGSRPGAGSGIASAAERRRKLALGDVGEGRPAGPCGSGREAPLDDRRVEVDHVDERAADVRGDRADAHSCQRLAKTGLEGSDEARDRLGGRQCLGTPRACKLRGELDREPRMDRSRADREDHRHRVDIENVHRADGKVCPPSKPGGGERRVDCARGEDRRHRQPVDRPRLVGQDEDFGLAAGGRDRFGRQSIQRCLKTGRPFGGVPRRVQLPDRDPAHRRAHGRARRDPRRSVAAVGPCAGRAAGRRGAPAAGRAPREGP